MDCSKVGQDLHVFSDGSHAEQKQVGKLSAKVRSEMDESLMGERQVNLHSGPALPPPATQSMQLPRAAKCLVTLSCASDCAL